MNWQTNLGLPDLGCSFSLNISKSTDFFETPLKRGEI